MKIAILSRNRNLYSTKRLVEAAELRGHSVQMLGSPALLHGYYFGQSDYSLRHCIEFNRNDFDAVIPRIGASVTYYGTAIVRQFEMMNIYSVNESVAITRSRDKLRSLQLLSRKGIGMPITTFAHSSKDINGIIKEVGGAPLVIKLLARHAGAGSGAGGD